MNSNMKKMLAILAPITLLCSFASPVFAVCDQDRLHVVRSEGASGGVQTYDFGPATVVPTFYYRYTTNNAVIIDRLNAAWVGHHTVRVVGNAAACGAAGVIRAGGAITFLYTDTFF